jgi:hypothetical protein
MSFSQFLSVTPMACKVSKFVAEKRTILWPIFIPIAVPESSIHIVKSDLLD